MQGQETSVKEDIDDQYRLLRRDVQHGRAEVVRDCWEEFLWLKVCHMIYMKGFCFCR